MCQHALIGLGNPGVGYLGTRHNIGFELIDIWLQRLDLELKPISKQFNSVIATIAEKQVVLVKPMTFMNSSGRAVMEVLDYYDLDVDRMVIICDDVNLAFGNLRLRAKGSDGGHRGLESIIQRLGTNNFPRQRIGVDLPKNSNNLIDYVLEEFNKEEASDLPFVIDQACRQLESFISDRLSKAATSYNGPSIMN